MARAYIGISGWRYAPWRGTFYPEDLAQKNELAYASRQVNSIEINGSFYSLQTAKSYQAWYDATPGDFVFSVKGGRYITHLRRLRDIEKPLANFFASGVLALGEKLGPILWQFPPNFQWDEEKFNRFFELLPRDTKAAAILARKHDGMVKKPLVKVEGNRELRHAMEVRHESFKNQAFIDLLRQNNIAVVVADTAGKWPLMEDVTADFVYVRLHGDEQIYVSGYTDEALDVWGKKVKGWLKGGEAAGAQRVGKKAVRRKGGREVYVYFDNDVKVRAPVDARGLMERVGLKVPERIETGKGFSAVEGEARKSWPGLRKRRDTARKRAD
jgi:uncharacterized protein YecE (DUF72 family)